MFRLFSFCLLALCSSVSMAQALVVSTYPIYLIAQKVTQNIETPTLLLADQTGHDVSLTPAHRKTIQDAGLMIWLGKAHEAPLEHVLHQNPKAIALLDAGIIKTLPQRSERGLALKNTVDSHVWLDPNNAVRIAFFIAALRSQQMPEHRDAYWNNARAFAQSLYKSSSQFQTQTAAQPYWAYHDAYQYLERALNLKFAGSLTNDPHIAPTVAQIKYLNDHRPNPKMCLLAEGHASKNQYMKLNPIVFQKVDESMRGADDFVQAWQQLAKQTKACVLNARK